MCACYITTKWKVSYGCVSMCVSVCWCWHCVYIKYLLRVLNSQCLPFNTHFVIYIYFKWIFSLSLSLNCGSCACAWVCVCPGINLSCISQQQQQQKAFIVRLSVRNFCNSILFLNGFVAYDVCFCCFFVPTCHRWRKLRATQFESVWLRLEWRTAFGRIDKLSY